jgi:dTDP-4-dehydrorhamnose 3,5-epimerase
MDKELITGIKIKPLKIIPNDKGNIFHYVRSDEGNFGGFGECYLSEIYPKKIKGWKLHKFQTQNLIVPVGKVQFILYDSRINSISKNKIQEVILGLPNDYNRLTIPFGIWYSFKCISNNKGLLINFTDLPHDSNESEFQNLYDNNIPFVWK